MRSDLIICICLAVICGMSGTGISTDDICEKKDEFKIISIFNLKSNLIIQAKDTQNGDQISYWSIRDTEAEGKSIPNGTIKVERFEDDLISKGNYFGFYIF